jgi:hypothetical protein
MSHYIAHLEKLEQVVSVVIEKEVRKIEKQFNSIRKI